MGSRRQDSGTGRGDREGRPICSGGRHCQLEDSPFCLLVCTGGKRGAVKDHHHEQRRQSDHHYGLGPCERVRRDRVSCRYRSDRPLHERWDRVPLHAVMLVDASTGRMFVAERWQGQESLTAHLQGQQVVAVQKWANRIRIDVLRYDALNERPLLVLSKLFGHLVDTHLRC
jgi:hypothetical protein